MHNSICISQKNLQGKEQKQHGDKSFPVAFYFDDLVKFPVSWHWHDEFELAIIVKGQTEFFSESDKNVLDKSEGIFINSGILHSAYDFDKSNSQLRSIVFHPKFIGGNSDSVFWQKYIHPLVNNSFVKSLCLSSSVSWQKEIIDFINIAWEIGTEKKYGYEILVRNYLSKIIFLLNQNCSQKSEIILEKSDRDSSRIKKMIEYIHFNYDSEITVQDIAEKAFISETECLRCFRNIIGISPIQYLINVRLQNAAEKLTTTNERIINIGLSCGFHDMSYFSKAFQRFFGQTPSVYRKNHKEL